MIVEKWKNIKLDDHEEDVIYLDMSFEEASKFIVSAGTSNKIS